MPYTHTTRVAFNNLIANRLGDSLKRYWTNDQINAIIDEALLTLGAVGGYWKDEVLVETTEFASLVGKQFYNLLDAADIKTGATHLEISRTYEDIIDWIDADLIDYTEIATEAEVIDLITNAINYFQTETKLILERERFNIIVGESIPVDEDILDIVAAYYINSSGSYSALRMVDEDRYFRQQPYSVDTIGIPRYYSLNNVSMKVVDLFPRPSENGFLELIYVKGRTGAQTTASTCLIPDNLTPYLKYKVEAELFSKDDNPDPYRAQYCQARVQEGLMIGKNYAAVVNTKVDGINRIPSSLHDFDAFRYGWLNTEEDEVKKVNSVALAGYNIIAVNRMPIIVHSARFEVIKNAPLADVNIDVRPDHLQCLLEYCLHLAAIKDGIAAIQKSRDKLEMFVKTAAEHNQYLQKRRISYLDLLQKSKYPLKQAKVEATENAA